VRDEERLLPVGANARIELPTHWRRV
jgi:hypothetical protein